MRKLCKPPAKRRLGTGVELGSGSAVTAVSTAAVGERSAMSAMEMMAEKPPAAKAKDNRRPIPTPVPVGVIVRIRSVVGTTVWDHVGRTCWRSQRRCDSAFRVSWRLLRNAGVRD